MHYLLYFIQFDFMKSELYIQYSLAFIALFVFLGQEQESHHHFKALVYISVP